MRKSGLADSPLFAAPHPEGVIYSQDNKPKDIKRVTKSERKPLSK